jgi:LuxR family transcriptional regulator, maltose regulon positive regulatory protein
MGTSHTNLLTQDNTSLAPLLLTKIQPPPVRPNAIQRPRLTDRLTTGLACKLTLLSAPPGFGKTTLLAAWVAQLPPGWKPAWVALGPEDNDVARFWSYVIAALQTVQPDFGSDLLARWHSPEPPPFETLLARLLNSLTSLNTPVILVLDDYHVIHSSVIHEALNQFLEYIPPSLHVVLAGRQQPALALANYRARGQLNELRAEDLRCTRQEVTDLLNRSLKLDLDAAALDLLATRTEGWLAGLHLAALSLHDRDDPAAFIKAFTGSHRYIVDYLGEEVLERQEPEIRDFLLHTAVLEQLCAPLCDALLEEAEDTPALRPSSAILHTLEKANLFLAPLDDERRWYRYHPLFAEFLRERLRRLLPDRVDTLHKRAYSWYRAHGMLREAVEHALEAKDFGVAAMLVAEEAEHWLQRGDAGAVAGWLDALPPSLLRDSPILRLLGIWMAMLSVDVDLAARQLAALERDLEAGNAEPVLWGRWHAVAGYVRRVHQADLDGSVAHTQQAFELLPEEDHLWRHIAWLNLGIVPLIRGDVRAAAQIFEDIARQVAPEDDLYCRLMSLTFLGRCQIALGSLQQAEITHRKALALAKRHGAGHWPCLGYIHLGLGMLERERQRPLLALQWTEKASVLGAEANNLELHLNAKLLSVDIHIDAGDFERAAASLRTLAEHVPLMGPVFQALYDALQASWALAQGDLAGVRQWVETCGLELALALDHPMQPGMTYGSSELLYSTLARALLALDRPAEAKRIAEALRHGAEADARITSTVQALALDAAALQAQGNTEAALTVLAQLLDLAEPEGYVRRFTEIDPPGRPLLREVLSRYAAQHPTRDYVHRLLAAFPETEPVRQPSEAASPAMALPEPLTEREMEILLLLGTELSAPDIAEQLYVAPSTVRSHIKSLYAKLDVHNRGEAVARAQDLNLI